MRQFLSILFIGFLSVACNNVTEEDAINTEFTPVTTTLDTSQIMLDTTLPANALQPGVTPTATPATTPAAAAAPRLNPAHGQPGHRCEIAVGAPLPANGAAVPLNPAPVPNTSVPVINNTGKNLNPPHGQPGHRCDIAVGQPLSSAPAAATPVTTSPVVPTSLQTTPTPVTPVGSILSTSPATTTAPATVTAPGMNPPHGQPGHRCDIDVGAPLPKG